MSWLDVLRKGENHAEQTSDSSDWWNFCCSDADVVKERENRPSRDLEAYELQNSNRGQKLRNFKWSAEEDALLKRLVYELKFDWETMAKYFPGKIPSQVAKRWINKLDPSIKKLRWTSEEDDTILCMVSRIGRNWKEISKHLEGRPPDAVKSRFHSNLRKKLDDEEHLSLVDLDPDSFLCLQNDTTSPTNIENTSQTHTDTKTSSSLGNMFSNLSTDTILDPSPKNSSSAGCSTIPSPTNYTSESSLNPSPKNYASAGCYTNPSPKNCASDISTNCIESKISPNSKGTVNNHMNGKCRLSREQKKELIRELHQRVEYLQTAIVTTSEQIYKLEDEIFGPESLEI